MTRIRKSIRIQTPVEEVFEYVTTPGNWPAWHPSSLGVEGATDHSLEPGEQVTEGYRVAGRRGRVVWTVRERETPRRWVIAGRAENGGCLPCSQLRRDVFGDYSGDSQVTHEHAISRKDTQRGS